MKGVVVLVLTKQVGLFLCRSSFFVHLITFLFRDSGKTNLEVVILGYTVSDEPIREHSSAIHPFG